MMIWGKITSCITRLPSVEKVAFDQAGITSFWIFFTEVESGVGKVTLCTVATLLTAKGVTLADRIAVAYL